MYYVYILQSKKDGEFYIGCTTKNRRPLKIVYTEEYNNSEEAFTREKQIKSYKGGVAFKK